MEGECYPAALADLQETIRRRFDDRRMSRTLGMHFIDYFPHREKGLIHYLLGEDAAAEAELKLSIQQYPSAKALFYLDKVRKRMMEKSGGQVSVPRLIINSPFEGGGGMFSPGDREDPPRTPNPEPLTPSEIWTVADPIVISGIAEDEQYVSEITVNKRPVFMEASGQSVAFHKEMLLAEGKHRIDISAKNLLGGVAERRLVLRVDRTGPVISITAADADKGIQGMLYDESGEMFLSTDGKDIPIPKGKRVPFSIATESGTAHKLLSAKDKLGNETQAEVRIEAPSEENLLIADAGLNIFATEVKSAALKIIPDGWRDRERVFLEQIHIKGKVKSQNLIRSLSINHKSLLQDPGTIVYFSYVMRLEEGENRIRIAAEDEFGNTDSKIIEITREIPEAFKMKYRYCLALHPFDLLSMTAEPETETKANLFQHFFLKELNGRRRFQIAMREEEQSVERISNSLQSVHAETDKSRSASRISNSLQRAGFESDENRSVQIRPDAAILGNLYKTRNGIEIAARFVDIETGEILSIADAYSETSDKAALASASETLAEKFHREFPMTDAGIMRVNAGFMIKKAQDTGGRFRRNDIKMKWPLLVYRRTGRDSPVPRPDTGADAKIVGEARIEGISDEYYRIKLTTPRGITVNEGDRIITR
jgi:hypothetical protein